MFAAATALVLTGCGGDAGTTTTDASTTTSVMATTTSSTMAATTTAPSTTTTTFGDRDSDALLVIGDWGSGTLPQGAVAGAMMRYAEDNAVEAILTTGDNFYSDDAEFLMHPFGWASKRRSLSGSPGATTTSTRQIASPQSTRSSTTRPAGPPTGGGTSWS
jgi:hypothetical protein